MRMSDVTKRFIELLKEDIARYEQAAKAWDELAKAGGRLENKDGKVIATAEEKAAEFRTKVKELHELISKVRS
jgi:predicted Zn-dependent protease